MDLLEKEIYKSNAFKSLRRISKNEHLAIGYSLYDFLITGKYKTKIDFDVYLPTKGINLQRPYVWTIQQQEEFIWSLIYERSIPELIFIIYEHETYEVIDGKQRLMTIKRYMDNEFPIHFKDKLLYWNDLPDKIKFNISHSNRLTYTAYYSYYDDLITDNEKIIIFNFYNFAGTQQEESHKQKLLESLNYG